MRWAVMYRDKKPSGVVLEVTQQNGSFDRLFDGETPDKSHWDNNHWNKDHCVLGHEACGECAQEKSLKDAESRRGKLHFE
jgi:hypothetical protein